MNTTVEFRVAYRRENSRQVQYRIFQTRPRMEEFIGKLRQDRGDLSPLVQLDVELRHCTPWQKAKEMSDTTGRITERIGTT